MNDEPLGAIGDDGPTALPGPIARLVLGATGCWAEREGELINVFGPGPDGTRLYSLRADQIAFELQPLLVTVQLYFLAFNNGRASLRAELKTKATEILKLVL